MSESKDSPDLVNQNNDPFGDIEPIKGSMPPQPATLPPPPARRTVQIPEQELSRKIQEQMALGSSASGQFRREIFLALMQGFAARGELSRRQPGTTLGVVTDADVQNICRHAAGVASFAYEAAKAARLS